MKTSFILCTCICLFLCLSVALSGEQSKIDGTWVGKIEIMGQTLDFVTNLRSEGEEVKGTMDMPMQGVNGLPLKDVIYNHPKISFVLETPQASAKFEGVVEGDTIKGHFEQGGIKGAFTLTRSTEEAKKETEKPKKPLPYNLEEVTFQNGDLKFTGELMSPKKEGKHPAVIMITGSGPQNRYEELFGWKIFQDIADHFTRHGIAVLLYDDRGMGGSSSNVFESTTADFATDALAAVKYLQSRGDINPKQIGLCGHSEGGIIAPLAASQSDDVAFIICMSGTGHTGQEIVLAQSELIARANETPEDEIKKNLDNSTKIFDLLDKGESSENLEGIIEEMAAEQFEAMTEEQKKDVSDPEKFLKSQKEGLMKQFTSEWFIYFLSYDPLPALKNVKCPALLLYGELDLQVPAEMSRKAMVAAIEEGGNKDFKAKTFPKANHLFQEATTGSPSEYTKLPKEFVPGFLELMTDWMVERVTVVK
ncbi:alpha/beta hydrolase family protein [Acidobacteriota bacterium]